MLNSNLPNINYIGPGSELRAVAAKFIGHVETFCGNSDRYVGVDFFIAAANRLGGSGFNPGGSVAQITAGQVLTFNGKTYSFSIIDGEITDIVVGEDTSVPGGEA